MKKARLVTVLLIIFVIISLSGCNMVTSKRLIVSNTSSGVAITGVQVNQFVGSRMMRFEDMMSDGRQSPQERAEHFTLPLPPVQLERSLLFNTRLP